VTLKQATVLNVLAVFVSRTRPCAFKSKHRQAPEPSKTSI